MPPSWELDLWMEVSGDSFLSVSATVAISFHWVPVICWEVGWCSTRCKVEVPYLYSIGFAELLLH